MSDVAVLREDFLGWCDHMGYRLYDWQREAFGEATRREGSRFVHRLAGISVPRGNGKSWGGARIAEWLLRTRRNVHVLTAALLTDGARVVLDHGREAFRGTKGVRVMADSILIPATGSRWTITSREHTASRGLHPDLVIYDEIGWARDDELFAGLLAAQASVEDPLFLVISTVGLRRSGPLWRVKELAEAEA